MSEIIHVFGTPMGRVLARILLHAWRCPECKAEVHQASDLAGGAWRLSRTGPEHACSGLHRYFGHVPAQPIS